MRDVLAARPRRFTPTLDYTQPEHTVLINEDAAEDEDVTGSGSCAGNGGGGCLSSEGSGGGQPKTVLTFYRVEEKIHGEELKSIAVLMKSTAVLIHLFLTMFEMSPSGVFKRARFF
jgi:hypothetical protein